MHGIGCENKSKLVGSLPMWSLFAAGIRNSFSRLIEARPTPFHRPIFAILQGCTELLVCFKPFLSWLQCLV